MLEMPVKHYCRAPRPIDYAPEVQPIIQTPDHSSFPSGHAIEAHAIATVLHYLMTGHSALEGVAANAMPFRLAQRIAVNRTIAGVHFPVDSLAGAVMGCALGDAIVALMQGGTLPNIEHKLNIDENPDFVRLELLAHLTSTETKTDIPQGSPILTTFWDKAKAEWPSAGGA